MRKSAYKTIRMKLQQLLVLGICFTVLPLSQNCELAIFDNTNAPVTVEDLEVTLSIDRTQYYCCDNIKMALTVRNAGDRSVVLRFNDGQIYDFTIKEMSTGIGLWRWSADRTFTQEAWSVILAPGEEITYSEVLNQVAEGFTRMEPGLYKIEARQSSEPELIARPVQIRILEQGFKTIDKGSCSGRTEPASFVIRDKEKWTRIWYNHITGMGLSSSLPDVDFLSHMIVAVFRGNFSTGGYSTEIKHVNVLKDRIEVAVVETSPNGIAMIDVTQPYHIVKLEKSDLPVEFVYNNN